MTRESLGLAVMRRRPRTRLRRDRRVWAEERHRLAARRHRVGVRMALVVAAPRVKAAGLTLDPTAATQF
jgi:hypothetical protein